MCYNDSSHAPDLEWFRAIVGGNTIEGFMPKEKIIALKKLVGDLNPYPQELEYFLQRSDTRKRSLRLLSAALIAVETYAD